MSETPTMVLVTAGCDLRPLIFELFDSNLVDEVPLWNEAERLTYVYDQRMECSHVFFIGRVWVLEIQKMLATLKRQQVPYSVMNISGDTPFALMIPIEKEEGEAEMLPPAGSDLTVYEAVVESHRIPDDDDRPEKQVLNEVPLTDLVSP